MIGLKRLFVTALAFSLASPISSSQAAENYYFRLRPSVSVLNQEPFSIHIEGDNAGIVGSSFNAKAEASSSREMLRFGISGGNLPPGVTLDPTSGSISGSPNAKGRFQATITNQDAFSSASAALDVQVYDALEIQTLISPYATVGKAYSATFNEFGGNQAFAWTLTGTLPSGLSFGNASEPTSQVSGVPTAMGLWDNLQSM